MYKKFSRLFSLPINVLAVNPEILREAWLSDFFGDSCPKKKKTLFRSERSKKELGGVLVLTV